MIVCSKVDLLHTIFITGKMRKKKARGGEGGRGGRVYKVRTMQETQWKQNVRADGKIIEEMG